MASRAVVSHHHHHQQQQQPKGEVKQKIVAAEGRSRRVLQDIGNLRLDQPAKGKPLPHYISKPVQRSFGTQLLANAQAAAEKNKRSIAGKVDEEAVEGKVNALKKVVEPAENRSSDITKTQKQKQLSSAEDGRNVSIHGSKSTRKNVKTLSSILSARSKAEAARELTGNSAGSITNIDAEDAGNELAVIEYIDDIYKFYKLTEDDGRVHDYMRSQPDINAKMRSILIDWLIEVHRKFELMPETLYLTINIVDRFLSMKAVPRKELQLVGIGSMLIACKYEEIWAPEVNDFVSISANAYVREEILAMEKAILEKLEWYLTVPTPYVFLVRYVKASDQSDKKMENMVFFLAELGLMKYEIMVSNSASVIAASAVYVARCSLNMTPFWTTSLQHHTGYSEDQIAECAKMLVPLHIGAPDSKLKAVYRKFKSSADSSCVELLSPARKNYAKIIMN